jgi:50S ribosomal protein L16 3-hydroxylase
VTGTEILETRTLDVEHFYRDHWRRRPVVWRGGAGAFLDPALNWSEVETLERDWGTDPPPNVRRRPDGGVLFAQHVQTLLPRFGAACRAVARRFGWDHCTADLSVTRGPGAGVGPHFDQSDNFVVQQQGTKSWRVGTPGDTPRERQRLRMLETAGFVPSSRLAATCPTVELHPGDVLYLPIFAPHEGVEAPGQGGSLSVTFAHNADSAWGRYARDLMRELSRRPAWWRPLPLEGPDPGGLAEELTDALRRVVEGSGTADGTAPVADGKAEEQSDARR